MTEPDPEVHQLFASLVSAFAALNPPLIPIFSPPATLQQIRGAELQLGQAFPVDLRELLLCANGQDFPAQRAHPIFPEFRFAAGDWSTATSPTWLHSVDQMVEMTGYHKDEYQEMVDDGPFEAFGPAVYHDDVIALSSGNDSDSLVIDLRPVSGGTVGQVVMVRTQPCQIAVISPSLRAFLAELVEGYSIPRFRVDSQGAVPFWIKD